jgi:AcrR family transcriptional regulator
MHDSVPEKQDMTIKPRKRAEPQIRRQALLDAALAVFSADGFAAAKLDDIAAKAGVAKGTIYLYFRDKDDLFEQIVRGAVKPVDTQLQTLAAMPDISTRDLLAKIFEVFHSDILATNRRLIIRLVLTEGARFPKIAEFYHREVISKGMGLVRLILQRGVARGEVASPDLARFPQLFFAPMMMAVLWDDLFAKFEPLDVDGMLATHCKVLTGEK